jgi:sec-independent protein translocase protein TatA
MIGDLFDSPWKILIIAVLVLVLFGSRKMPDAARSLGRSMRILKSEVQGLHEDEPSAPVQTTAIQQAPAQIQPVADTQAQIDALQTQLDDQKKVADLQKQLSDLQQQQAK